MALRPRSVRPLDESEFLLGQVNQWKLTAFKHCRAKLRQHFILMDVIVAELKSYVFGQMKSTTQNMDTTFLTFKGEVC